MDVEQIQRALAVVDSELFMRRKVFSKEPKKMERKVADMNLVREVLLWTLSKYPMAATLAKEVKE